DDLSVTNRHEGPGGSEQYVLLECLPGDLECVANRELALLDPSDNRDELPGRVQGGAGGVASSGLDRLPVDEALDQVSGRSTGLGSKPALLAQIRLGGLRRDDVDRLDRRACERKTGLSREPQARGLLGAGIPVGEQRDAVGVDEHVEADSL